MHSADYPADYTRSIAPFQKQNRALLKCLKALNIYRLLPRSWMELCNLSAKHKK